MESMDARILIVDDDRRIRDMLLRNFVADGYRVDAADSAESGLAALRTNVPDIVVLDVGLPMMDGFEACRRIRREGHNVAVILLTARGEVADRVTGLDAGADDYIPKPFAYEELAARVRALVRRARPAQTDVLRFGDLVLDSEARSVRRGERELDLTRREFDFLELLMRSPRVAIERWRIIEDVWDDSIDIESNALDVYVGYLRKKLEAGDEGRILHTVRGVGYVLKEPAQ